MSHKMNDNKVFACPECDAGNPRVRVTKEPPYRCKQCSHEFAEPVIREQKPAGPSGDLIEACPHCNNADLSERQTQSPKYLCLGCRNEFNEPVKRGRKRANKHDSIEKLGDLNPEDVGLSPIGERNE